MQVDISKRHIQTVRDGREDSHKHDAGLSRVIQDNKIYYYELNGWVSKAEFQSFVADAWACAGDEPAVGVNDEGAFTIRLD